MRPPWDTGVPAPEIVRFIQGRPPAHAIDIGCGTGTNLLYLARQKWAVTGIDFAPLAIEKAHKKLMEYPARLLVADVARLADLDLPGPYDLAIDMGCFHSLAKDDRVPYVSGLVKWLARGGMFMVYAFQPSPPDQPMGLSREDICAYFKENFDLINYEQGEGRPSAWYYFKRK